MNVQINEATTMWLEITLRDREGRAPASQPLSVMARIDCVTTNTAIRALTPIIAANRTTLTITPHENRIIRTSSPREERRVTVIANYGPADQVTQEFRYWVRNLGGIA